MAVEVAITFDPNPDSRVVGYKLHYGLSQSLGNVVDLGSRTLYRFSNLREGVVYYFAATAYDASRTESAFSNMVVYKVPAVVDSDGDGLSDELENGCCTDPKDTDTDNDGLSDGIEDENKNCTVDLNETDPCNWDTDNDSIADGDEDVNKNGTWDSSELDPLSEDTDNDGYGDGLERTLGTDPLNGAIYPFLACIGTCDQTCDVCVADIQAALSMVRKDAAINYLKVRGKTIFDGNTALPPEVLLDIESGQVVLEK